MITSQHIKKLQRHMDQVDSLKYMMAPVADEVTIKGVFARELLSLGLQAIKAKDLSDASKNLLTNYLKDPQNPERNVEMQWRYLTPLIDAQKAYDKEVEKGRDSIDDAREERLKEIQTSSQKMIEETRDHAGYGAIVLSTEGKDKEIAELKKCIEEHSAEWECILDENHRADQLAVKVILLVQALKVQRQFLTWLGYDSLQHQVTSAGESARSKIVDIDKALKAVE
jgi:hypothetical protein